MKGFSMGVTTAYTTEAVMSLSLESQDEENKKTLASVLQYKHHKEMKDTGGTNFKESLGGRDPQNLSQYEYMSPRC